jgi:hypothetical protein
VLAALPVAALAGVALGGGAVLPALLLVGVGVPTALAELRPAASSRGAAAGRAIGASVVVAGGYVGAGTVAAGLGLPVVPVAGGLVVVGGLAALVATRPA